MGYRYETQYLSGSVGKTIVYRRSKYDQYKGSYVSKLQYISTEDKTAFDSFEEFCDRFGSEIDTFAEANGINPLYLRAFVYTESGGTGFYKDGKLLIRFENYTFIDEANKLGSNLSKDLVKSVNNSNEYYRKSINSPWISIHDTEDTRYAALTWAKSINEEAAYRSISMGFPQVMGFNYDILGYSSAKQMFNEFSKDYNSQVKGFTSFILKSWNGDILNALQRNDYTDAIKKYNGDSNYSGSLKKFEMVAGII